jgi:phage terminase large subunit
LSAGLVKFYGGSAQEPASFRYRNGSVIVVGGLDRATRLLSTEYDLAFIDEAIEASEEDIDTLVTRLRNGRLSYQQLLMATNPGPPTHHLKQRADAGRCRILYSRHEDNPRMHDGRDWTAYGRDYLARLDSLTGARYQRMRWGKWVSAEGLVYEGFDPAIHVIDRFEIPAEWPAWVSVDFGFNHPFVAQIWREDGDGRLYLTHEIFATGGLVEDHARTLKALLAQLKLRPRSVICDHDAEDRATLERHLGYSTTPARKTVSDGIQAVQSRLRVQADGKPRLFLLRDTAIKRDPVLVEASRPACTEEEFASYVWAIKPGGELKEEPVKEMDDGMDCLRYMVAERDMGRQPRFRSFTY